MDPIQLSLAGILVIGFGLVLYTAPIKYTDIQKTILILGGGMFLLIATWHAAVRITFIVLSEYIEAAKLEQARSKVMNLQLPPTYELIGVALLGSYWFVLQINRAIERTKQIKRKKGTSV